MSNSKDERRLKTPGKKNSLADDRLINTNEETEEAEDEEAEELEDLFADDNASDKEASSENGSRQEASKEIEETEEETDEEAGAEESEEKKEKKPHTKGLKRRHVVLIVLIVLLLAASVLIAFFSDRIFNFFSGDASYTLQATDTVVEGSSNTVSVQMVGSHLVRCSPDGVQALDEDGNVSWDIPYTMSSPYMVSDGTYVSVADRLGLQLLTIQDGQIVTQITTESNILLNCINSRGMSAVALETDDGNVVNLYSREGETLMQRHTYSSSDGVPMAIALSDDGTRMGTAYVSYNGTSVKSILTIFDLTETGSALTDRIVGSMTLEGTVISDIRFVEQGCFFAGTDQIGVVSTGTAVDTVWSQMLSYQINSLSMTDDYAVIRFGDGLAGVAEPVDKNIVVYNYEGRVLYSESNETADYLEIWGDTIVIGAERAYKGISSTGKPKWTLESADAYNGLYVFPDGKKVAAVNGGTAVYYQVTLRRAGDGNE